MAVKLKNAKTKEEKGTIINFDEKDFIAVKGLKGSFFEGKTKVVHKVHGQKLIDRKLAEATKDEVVKDENLSRTVKDLPKN